MGDMQGSDAALSKNRKPQDTKFKQQKLPAWQPILTASTVLPAFFALGIAFIPLGVALLITSNNIHEFVHDYTDCKEENGNETCLSRIDTNSSCVCLEKITLDVNFTGKVYLYYGLSNFYQNHRRYVKSRDDDQLRGVVDSTLSTECEPYKIRPVNGVDMNIAPCGAIANSLFNDTYTLTYHGKDGNSKLAVGLLKNNIAWASDKDVKFKNPTTDDWKSKTVPPPAWRVPVYELDGGFQNEDLIVWMRTAALPTFRKLHRRVNHTNVFVDGLPAGNYSLRIQYNYPVSQYAGRKRFILSTTSWLGGKNSFLGIAYLVVGSICIVLGAVFLVIHLKMGKTESDMNNINNRTEY